LNAYCEKRVEAAYHAYDRIRAYLYKLLDAKFGTNAERMKYYACFLTEYDFNSFLDIGCGKGLIFNNISEREKEKCSFLVGVDLTRTDKRQYEHVVADAGHLPFKDGAFDLATAFSLVEHIPIDKRGQFYVETKRIAKSGGAIIFQLPNRFFVVESHSYFPFFGFLPASMHSFAYRGVYVAVPSLKKLIKDLEECQYKICSVEKYEGIFLPFGEFLSKIGFFHFLPVGYVIHTQVS
jgi:ubiquinone/menaquinone biosynthesis C-methylase UbiE